jgi:hypothetical protein
MFGKLAGPPSRAVSFYLVASLCGGMWRCALSRRLLLAHHPMALANPLRPFKKKML